MKMVVAYIRNEAFEPIRTELLGLGFPSLSITEVKGSGRQKGDSGRYRGAALTDYLRPKLKIECAVEEGDVQTVVDTFLKHARTGEIGDGKVVIRVPRLGIEPETDGAIDREPILSGDEEVGEVVLLAGKKTLADNAREVLHLAAVVSLTEIAIAEAREEVEQNLRGSFLEELRSRDDLEPSEVVRRAGRLGCDLSRGAVVLCAALTTDRPRHVVATIAGEWEGALAENLDGRVYALMPATGGDDAPERTL